MRAPNVAQPNTTRAVPTKSTPNRTGSEDALDEIDAEEKASGSDPVNRTTAVVDTATATVAGLANFGILSDSRPCTSRC